MLGTNDLLQRLGLVAEICAQRMERFLSAMLAEALANELRIHFADTGKWGVELTFDGVHFSEAGHRAFAERMSEVSEALNEKSCGAREI